MIHAETIPERIVALEDACYAVTPGTAALCVLDFVANAFLQVHIKAAPPLMDIAASTDGAIWLLDAEGQLARLPSLTLDIAAITKGTGLIHLQPVAPCAISGAAEELSMSGRSVLIRTRERLYQFELPTHDKVSGGLELPMSAQASLPCENCVIVKGSSEATRVFLGLDSERIVTGDLACKVTSSKTAPRHWRTWELRAACRCPSGIYAMFDDGDAGQLVLLDGESLQPLAYYLHRARTTRTQYRSLSGTLDGRVFVHKGEAVYLIGETGSPSPRWFRYRTLEKAPNG